MILVVPSAGLLVVFVYQTGLTIYLPYSITNKQHLLCNKPLIGDWRVESGCRYTAKRSPGRV